ncbi:hypothetical protein L210DRAFT_2160883 [Boletus edulis BED1]|uniref:Uncharacterized protein n=1 Tax=Boletus edulis BED1 TaxID=1328754 RepID=A0AAD4BA77_BOLED|nr:hypothetical protein L210DRAFT_2759403 [Boletus edulis BED1]KAF8440517.1 hypothetical protein L210DRAFT_2160883 [Boletus edulis BED1]
MIRATRIATCVCLLALAASLPLSEHEETRDLDVRVPWFTQPDVDTTWISYEKYYVQWENVPPVIDNFDTALYFIVDLHASHSLSNNTNLLPLATGFNFTEGQVEIRAPNAASGIYRLLLESSVWGIVIGPIFTLHRS